MLKSLRVEDIESDVRSYCRTFPSVFRMASGSVLYDDNENGYLDFLAGCGSLNYGHNHPDIKASLLEYIEAHGVVMSFDFHTCSKQSFLEAFSAYILQPRSLDYKIQFPGPTGTNAIEAAIKLARKVTGRSNVIAFTNGFHGCSLGALALTGNRHHRSSSSHLLSNVTRVPYDGYFGAAVDTSAYLEKLLSDPSSGYDEPAAIVLETIQGEGGLNVASIEWLRSIQRVARKHGALLIVDDIQAGCGRSGDFFSFEASGIVPDIVCLAKSISGFGLPMSLVLMRPDLDEWKPGEHNGTFRGNNYAFVTATRALELFWKDTTFTSQIRETIDCAHQLFGNLAKQFGLEKRGRGLMLGLNFMQENIAADIQRMCFEQQLIVETCGPNDEILKLLPPLNVSRSELEQAALIVEAAIKASNKNNDTIGNTNDAYS